MGWVGLNWFESNWGRWIPCGVHYHLLIMHKQAHIIACTYARTHAQTQIPIHTHTRAHTHAHRTTCKNIREFIHFGQQSTVLNEGKKELETSELTNKMEKDNKRKYIHIEVN